MQIYLYQRTSPKNANKLYYLIKDNVLIIGQKEVSIQSPFSTKTVFGEKDKIEINVNNLKDARRYVIFYSSTNNLFVSNLDANNSYLYELFLQYKTLRQDADPVLIDIVKNDNAVYILTTSEIEEESSNIEHHDSNSNLYGICDLIKLVKPDDNDLLQDIAKQDFDIYRHRNFNSFIRPQNSLSYLDVEVDFLIAILDFIISNDTELEKKIKSIYPEYTILINKMLDSSILKRKTVSKCLESLNRKIETRKMQEQYYKEVLQDASIK